MRTRSQEYVRCMDTIHFVSYAGATIMGTAQRGDRDDLDAFLYWAFNTINEAEVDVCALELETVLEGLDHE